MLNFQQVILEQPLTRCNGVSPSPRRPRRRTVLPSIGTSRRSPLSHAAQAAIPSAKLRGNAAGSKRQKTRRKVSCEGMPGAQAEALGQPVALGVSLRLDGRPGLGSRNAGTEGDADDVEQFVRTGAFGAGIDQVGEVLLAARILTYFPHICGENILEYSTAGVIRDQRS